MEGTDQAMAKPYALLLIACAACQGSLRGEPAFGSREDVAAVLDAGGARVPPSSLRCVNPTIAGRAIRAVACTLTLTPSQVTALTAGLSLTPGAPLFPRRDGSCDAGGEVLVGKNPRVPNGIGRVELHVLNGSQACVEMEYPWSS